MIWGTVPRLGGLPIAVGGFLLIVVLGVAVLPVVRVVVMVVEVVLRVLALQVPSGNLLAALLAVAAIGVDSEKFRESREGKRGKEERRNKRKSGGGGREEGETLGHGSASSGPSCRGGKRGRCGVVGARFPPMLPSCLYGGRGRG